MRKFVLPLLLVIEVVFFLRQPNSGIRFESLGEFSTTFGYYLADVIPQAVPLLILAFGMTIVLMTAGIDLSIGSMVALIACVMSSFDGGPSFWITAVPVGLMLAMALGFFNGSLIARFDVPPIIATLGTLFFYRGLCEVVMRGLERAPFGDTPGYVWLGEVTGSAFIAGILLLAGGAYFSRSRWQREILMLGGNRVAARYAGIPVHRRILEVYTFMGILAFLAALTATAHDGSVNASWRTGLELKVIVAVVLGGTRVDGGHGTVLGSMVGVLLIAVLDEGLRSASMSDLQPILLGALLVMGVWLNTHAVAIGVLKKR